MAETKNKNDVFRQTKAGPEGARQYADWIKSVRAAAVATGEVAIVNAEPDGVYAEWYPDAEAARVPAANMEAAGLKFEIIYPGWKMFTTSTPAPVFREIPIDDEWARHVRDECSRTGKVAVVHFDRDGKLQATYFDRFADGEDGVQEFVVGLDLLQGQEEPDYLIVRPYKKADDPRLSDDGLVCYGCAHSSSSALFPGRPSGERPCGFCVRNPEIRQSRQVPPPGYHPGFAPEWYGGLKPVSVPMDCYHTCDVKEQFGRRDQSDMGPITAAVEAFATDPVAVAREAGLKVSRVYEGRRYVAGTCDRPPPGWFCTGEKDHSGPCAAVPLDPKDWPNHRPELDDPVPFRPHANGRTRARRLNSWERVFIMVLLGVVVAIVIWFVDLAWKGR